MPAARVCKKPAADATQGKCLLKQREENDLRLAMSQRHENAQSAM